MKTGNCLNCKELLVLGGRHLCGTCYSHHHNHHTLDRFPRSTWKHADLMAEYDLCRSRGLTVRESAEKIGVKLSALRKAIQRSRTLSTPTDRLWDQGHLERKIN